MTMRNEPVVLGSSPTSVRFRSLRVALLDELRQSGHGVSVDLDTGDQVGVVPGVGLGGGTTQLDLRAPLNEGGDDRLVGITGGDVTVRAVRLIVERHMSGIGVEHDDHLRLRLPVRGVGDDESRVEENGRHVPLERQRGHADRDLHLVQLDRNVDMQRIVLR